MERVPSATGASGQSNRLLRWAGLGGLAVLALLLFLHPSRGLFWFDTSGLAEVRGLLREGQMPLRGMPVHGEAFHHPGPLYTLLLAVPYALRPHVSSGYAFFGLSGLLAAVCAWGVGRRYLGAMAGAWILWLFIADWMAMLSRDHETIGCLTLFAFLLLGAALELVVRRRSWPAAVLPPLMAAALQINLSMMSIVPALLWAMWVSRPWIRLRHLAAGIAGACLLFAPYALGGLRGDWPALIAALEHGRLTRDAPYWRVLWEVVQYEPRFFTTARLDPPLPVGIACWIAAGIWLRWTLAIAAAGWVLAAQGMRDSAHRPMARLLALWGLVPAVLWASGERLMAFHYMIPAKAAAIAMSGWFIADQLAGGARRAPHRVVRAAVLAAVVVVLSGGVLANMATFQPQRRFMVPEPYAFVSSRLSGRRPPLGEWPRVGDAPVWRQPSALNP